MLVTDRPCFSDAARERAVPGYRGKRPTPRTFMRLSNYLRTAAAVAVLVCCAVFGARPASASGIDTTGTLPFGGLDRPYVLHVPAGVDRPSGLVINLHGAGENGGKQAALANYNAAAAQHG